MNCDVIKYKNLRQFKRDHKLFFENKPAGECHNVYKGFLLTSANYPYVGWQVKVWQENEVGTLIVFFKANSLDEAKKYIDDYFV